MIFFFFSLGGSFKYTTPIKNVHIQDIWRRKTEWK